MKLNLGACDRRVEGFLSVDICEPADQIVDLAGPWPWPDSSVEEVLAYSVFEHIGDCDHVSRWLCDRCLAKRCGAMLGEKVLVPVEPPLPMRHFKAKIHVMNELHRILVPGGRATIVLPHATKGDGGHCDPTHSSYWTQSDFEYYQPGLAERERFRDKGYGITADFNVTNLVQGKIPITRYPRTFGGEVYEMTIVLEAVKK
jgi:hypothetical protein